MGVFLIAWLFGTASFAVIAMYAFFSYGRYLSRRYIGPYLRDLQERSFA